MTIGEKIRKVRTDKGLTQKQLADRMSVTQSHVWQYENGLVKPSDKQVKKFADALGVSVKELLSVEENNKTENESIAMTVGERIREIRQKAGLTQKQLADRMGVTPSQIGQYERGLVNPSNTQIKKFADALNIPFEILLADQINNIVQADKDKADYKRISYRVYTEIEQKFSHINYSIDGDESEGYSWINYPDGTLNINENDLEQINIMCNKFLHFLLADLKETKKNDFKPN